MQPVDKSNSVPRVENNANKFRDIKSRFNCLFEKIKESKVRIEAMMTEAE